MFQRVRGGGRGFSFFHPPINVDERGDDEAERESQQVDHLLLAVIFGTHVRHVALSRLVHSTTTQSFSSTAKIKNMTL